MKTAILGLGNIGSTVARQLAAGGQTVLLADHTPAKAQQLANEFGGNARALPIDEAIAQADVVVMAVWFDAIAGVLDTHRSALAGKLIVDPSNPIAPDGKGGFTKTIPAGESAGERLAAGIPPGAQIVKAFGTLSAESLKAHANRQPERAVLFYAADFPEAGHAIETLINAAGYTPLRVGGIDQSIRLEVGGELHEFGKLGRLVSLKEAQALV